MARKLAPAAGGRNSKRSLRTARATRRYGTATPTDEQIRADAVRARGLARQQRSTGVKPKTTKPKTTKPKTTKPKTKKPTAKKEKPSFDKYLSEQTPANARNALENASGRNTGASTVSNRDSYSGSRYKKSLDQALDNLTSVMKQEEVQQECRLWKAELNETFNNLLDSYQVLYKDYETDKFNEAEGKSKKKPITNTGRSGKGSLGSDSPTPALGTTASDQKVMQS